MEAARSVLIDNIRRVLEMAEPDHSKHASLLADRMGVTRQTGHRLLKGGTSSLTTLHQVAGALDISTATLLDASLMDAKVVRARMHITDTVFDYHVVAWLDPNPYTPWNLAQLVCYRDGDFWRISSYGAAESRKVYRVLHYEGKGEPISRPYCNVGVYFDGDDEEGLAVAQSLSGHGYTTLVVQDDEHLSTINDVGKPDVLIIRKPDFEKTCQHVRERARRTIPTIVMIDKRPPIAQNQADKGMFFCEPQGAALLHLLRTMFSFKRPLGPIGIRG